MNRIKKESSIKEVRAYYGMTQTALADHLCVTRGLLSMAELKQRELPFAAGQQLNNLYMAMRNDEKAPPAKASKVIKADQKTSRVKQAAKLAHNQRKLAAAGKRLAKLQDEHSRAVNIMASLAQLRKDASPGDLKLFDVIEMDAQQLYSTTGEDARLDLELRMEALKAENAYLEKDVI